MIKEKRNIRQENVIRAQFTKQSRSFMSHQAIPSKVFDSSISNPLLQNSFLDQNLNQSYNVMLNTHHKSKESEVVIRQSAVYGSSPNEYANPGPPVNDEHQQKSQSGKRLPVLDPYPAVVRKSTSYMKDRMNRRTVRQQVFKRETPLSSRDKNTYNISAIEHNRKRNMNRIKQIISSDDDAL